jgi:molybdopterin/thiamine biosynthesis adenylyltransferase
MQNICFPRRYDRNYQTIDDAEQQRLFKARIAVVGCGGLGGYIAEELARLGVGCLVLIDGDRHEETNLNRQLTATENTLGSLKVLAAQERLAQVNSNVVVEAHAEHLTSDNAGGLLAGVDLVMDALDSITARLMLEQACEDLGIPLIFAAIDGWYGMLGVDLPGDRHMAMLYGNAKENRDTPLSNPAFTPAVIASLAVAESIKVLLDKPLSLLHAWLQVDLFNMTFDQIRFPVAEDAEARSD